MIEELVAWFLFSVMVLCSIHHLTAKSNHPTSHVERMTAFNIARFQFLKFQRLNVRQNGIIYNNLGKPTNLYFDIPVFQYFEEKKRRPFLFHV